MERDDSTGFVGGVALDGANDYQKWVEQCAHPARTVTGAIDRARWLELVKAQTDLNRIDFQRLPLRRSELDGLWRGSALNNDSRTRCAGSERECSLYIAV